MSADERKVLITGGNGLLARALVQAFGANDGATIRTLDTAFDSGLPFNVEAINGDLRDAETTRRALEGVQAVVHLAPLYPSKTANPAFGPDNDVLDQATRGTYVLLTEMQKAGVNRLVLGSTLALFDALPSTYQVDERWRPRPLPAVEHLGPWLAELSARECVRVASICAACLRFGRISSATSPAAYDALALHLEDAVTGLRAALDWTGRDETPPIWRVFHITPGGYNAKIRISHFTQQTLGYEPQHTVNDAASDSPPLAANPIQNRSIRRVVIFGAGGPVAAALAQELSPSYTLRLTDARPLDEIARENKQQTPGAPVAAPLPPPHENRVVDVRDPVAVLAACEGMDAIINGSVVRHDPVEAFRVNTLGAYNIVQAAVAHSIRRVVQTGPQLLDSFEDHGYSWEYDVPGDAPPRPGTKLYFHSKYLGQEICRVFAENYGLEVPVLLYCMFYNPDVATSIMDFSVSWQDSSRALRAALESPSFPSPYEVMNVVADLPHGRYSNARAKLLLHWQPRDDFRHLWADP